MDGCHSTGIMRKVYIFCDILLTLCIWHSVDMENMVDFSSWFVDLWAGCHFCSLQVACHSGDLDVGLKVLKEMKDRGVKPVVATFNTLLSSCSYHVSTSLVILLLVSLERSFWQIPFLTCYKWHLPERKSQKWVSPALFSYMNGITELAPKFWRPLNVLAMESKGEEQ
jgi:pentatricopeptide repeat protein